MQVLESEKLVWNDYVPAVTKDPLSVYYMRQSCEKFDEGGFSFNIYSPSKGALLDPEGYIKYTLVIDNSDHDLFAFFFTPLDEFDEKTNDWNAVHMYPENIRSDDNQFARHFAFRSGNVMTRAMQSCDITINGLNLQTNPCRWVDVLNRLHVGNEESEHIFCASGGKFDNGDHGTFIPQDGKIITNQVWETDDDLPDVRIRSGEACFTPQLGDGVEHDGSLNEDLKGYNWHTLLNCNFNEGFGSRNYKLLDLLRGIELDNGSYSTPGIPKDSEAMVSMVNTASITIEIYEPIPIYPFKMYQNDYVVGVIPNIFTMALRCNFLSNIDYHIFRSSTGDPYASLLSVLDWSKMGTSNCEILLKWYNAPFSVSIPKEVTLPLRKIKSEQFVVAESNVINNTANVVAAFSISQFNISLDAIPDLLLIYIRPKMESENCLFPDDFHGEIKNLNILLENHGGKISQIQSFQCYKNWLKYIKHTESKKPTYLEWKKYMFVAILKPEDYGIIRGPGYDNNPILGITGDVLNHHSAHKFNSYLAAPSDRYYNTSDGKTLTPYWDLTVTQIYDRWALTLMDNGQARAGLTRIRETMSQAMNSLPQNPSGISTLMQ